MKMHNDPHSWMEFIELLHSWWRGETPMGAVLLSVAMAAMRIAYGGGGWKKMTLEGAICAPSPLQQYRFVNHENGVSRLVKVGLTQGQFDALVSFTAR